MQTKALFITLAALLASILPAAAQAAVAAPADGTVYVDALFTYPEAPEYLGDITSRSDYLMDNFWTPMDFKQKTVNQAALQHAFDVYVAPMMWAQKAKVVNSVAALVKKLSKNPSLATQFMRAAEEALHSRRSEFYIDEVYEMMLEGYVANKKVPKERKTRYATQLSALRATKPGSPMPAVALTDSVGNAVEVAQGLQYTVVVFGSPRQDEMRQWTLRLGAMLEVERLCRDGIMAIAVADTDEPSEEGNAYLASLPGFVTGGYVRHPEQTFDIRISPCAYIVAGDGTVLARNVAPADAFVTIARDAAKKQAAPKPSAPPADETPAEETNAPAQ